MPGQIEDSAEYRMKYKTLKRKLRMLIYENECFKEELGKANRALLRVEQDCNFLLEHLLPYYRPRDSSSDSDATDVSDNETYPGNVSGCNSYGVSTGNNNAKRRKTESTPTTSINTPQVNNCKPSSQFSTLHTTRSLPLASSKPTGNTRFQSTNPIQSGSSGGVSGKAAGSTQIATQGPGPVALSSAPRKRSQLSLASSSRLAKNNNRGTTSRQKRASQKPATVMLQEGSRLCDDISLTVRNIVDEETDSIAMALPNQLFPDDHVIEGDLMMQEVETSPSNLEDDAAADNYE